MASVWLAAAIGIDNDAACATSMIVAIGASDSIITIKYATARVQRTLRRRPGRRPTEANLCNLPLAMLDV